MELDDTVCFCFHVSLRKLRNYARLHRPIVASQMSECFGAGTGCGWCRTIIVKVWEAEMKKPGKDAEAPTLASLAQRKADREQYWMDKLGKKPPPEKS